MKIFSNLMIACIVSCIALAGCEKDEVEQVDNLEQTGIIGQWKLETRTVNGITHLAVECCDYITFQTDSEPGDLKGAFQSTGVGYETNGVFELNPSIDTIQFNWDDNQLSYGVQISDRVVTFSYSENDEEIVEDWRKQD